MCPESIRTEADLAAALKRVEALIDARPGSPEEAELELWTLIGLRTLRPTRLRPSVVKNRV